MYIDLLATSLPAVSLIACFIKSQISRADGGVPKRRPAFLASSRRLLNLCFSA